MKRQHKEKKKTEEPVYQLAGLPSDVWHNQIWSRCGPGQGLPWARVSKAWQRLAYSGILHFSPRLLPYGKNLWKALTVKYLGQFTNLRSFFLTNEHMRLSSALPALASLTQLRTLVIGPPTILSHERQLEKLTQLTALDFSGSYGSSSTAIIGLTQLKLLHAHSTVGKHVVSQVHALRALTYLNLDHTKTTTLQSSSLEGLTMLQYFSAQFCNVDSYAFLSSLRSLVFLNLDCCRSLEEYDSPPLIGLASLTSLSVVRVRVSTETILALTHLRSLGIGDGCEKYFGLVSLNPVVMDRLTHLHRLSYNEPFVGPPERVWELGLSTRHNFTEGMALNQFKRWHHPLPPNYFSLSHSGLSPFMNDQ